MKDKSFHGLILSLCAHLLVAWLILVLPEPSEGPKTDLIEIDLMDQDRPKKTFVTETDEGKISEKLKDQADYLSRLNKRVQEQTRARKTGPTKNAQPGSNQASDSQLENLQKQVAQDLRPKGSGFMALPNSQPKKSVVIGESSISEFIPGVKEGAFTALNTNQFTYYSFFSRVNEQIRTRWVDRVRQFAGRQGPREMQLLAQYERLTEIEILLSPEGDFIKGVVLRSSGYPDLDQTGIDAFRNAAPFINPPKEMIDEQGMIRLTYSFVVVWRPRHLAEKAP